MTTTLTVEQMVDELMLNYIEAYHEDGDFFNPDAYQEQLDDMDDEEIVELYNDTFDY